MHVLSCCCWGPYRLEKQGNLRESAARNLLAVRGAELGHSSHDVAKDLLDHAENIRKVLRGKHLLTRYKLARQYDRMANDALRTIENMLVPPLLHELGRHSRPMHS